MTDARGGRGGTPATNRTVQLELSLGSTTVDEEAPPGDDSRPATDELQPSVVWALLEGVQVGDERGWDGTTGLLPVAWETPITHLGFLQRLAACKDVKWNRPKFTPTAFVVGRFLLGPKIVRGGDWHSFYWNGSAPLSHFTYASTGPEYTHDIQCAAVFDSRDAALRALLGALPQPLPAPALEGLNNSFIIGVTHSDPGPPTHHAPKE